jgi:hypothetical protein
VNASSSQIEELFDPVDDKLLTSSKLIDSEFGFMIEKPSHEWNWYISKQPIYQRNYLLIHSENNWNYIIGFNKKWKPLNKNSVQEHLQGIKDESNKQGFKINNVSYEFTGIYDKHSFLLSFDILSNNDEIMYRPNIHVMFVNGVYMYILQYQSEGFGINELKELLNGVEVISSADNVTTKDDTYYYDLGRRSAKYIILMLAAVGILLLISLLIKSRR